MKSSFKMGHLLLLFFILVSVFKFGHIAGIFSLLISLPVYMFSDSGYTLNLLDLNFTDHILSALLITALPVITIIKWKKLNKIKLGFNSIVVLLLMFLFIFAPIISNTNPDLIRDLRVTKLLPPFSSLEILHLRSYSGNDLFNKRNKIIPGTYNNNIVFADSISVEDKVIIYQQEKIKTYDKKDVLFVNNKPETETTVFLLGTDEYGRDIYSRLVYGTRISLAAGCGAVFITLIFGVGLGFIAGYSGGLIDSILNRFTDMLLAFPVIFLIILLIALFGNSLVTVILVLGYSGWMSLFKIVRGEVISVKGKDYFISAKLGGIRGRDLLLKEVLPVIIAPVIVNLVFQFGNVILAESALSFLGLGTGSSYPSWGGMIDSGQQYLGQAWWMIVFPGLALVITLFTANNLGREINIYFNPVLKDDK